MSDKLNKLRHWMKQESIDVLLISCNDEFRNECPPLREARIKWLTGYTDVWGFAMVTATEALLFMPALGLSVAELEVDQTIWSLQDMTKLRMTQWLKDNLQSGQTFALEGMRYSVNELQQWQSITKRQDAHLKQLDVDVIDPLWTDRPAHAATPASVHLPHFAGTAHTHKISEFCTFLTEHRLDGYLITDPGHVCWLLNLRGRDIVDVPYFTPVLLSRAFVTADGAVILFTDPAKITDAVTAHLGPQVTVQSLQNLMPGLTAHDASIIGIDPSHCPTVIAYALKEAGKDIRNVPCPVELSRGLKNETEINGAKSAHLRDAVAVIETHYWLDTHTAPTDLTEQDVVDYMEFCRQKLDLFVDKSFSTLAGSGPHSAIIHYHVSPTSNIKLIPDNLLLIDSGGQYYDGTTDITRTIAIGTPTTAMIADYTTVLQSHIAVARARFPHGTTGVEFEALARGPLWDADGKDFKHRIGHGIGSFAGVHEGPQIFVREKPEAVAEHMLVTIEPGYYKTDHYGIRLENVALVKDVTTDKDAQPMLGFEALTMVPFESRVIDFNRLTLAEKKWLHDYHQMVLDKMTPLLRVELQAWLKKKCQAF